MRVNPPFFEAGGSCVLFQETSARDFLGSTEHCDARVSNTWFPTHTTTLRSLLTHNPQYAGRNGTFSPSLSLVFVLTLRNTHLPLRAHVLARVSSPTHSHTPRTVPLPFFPLSPHPSSPKKKEKKRGNNSNKKKNQKQKKRKKKKKQKSFPPFFMFSHIYISATNLS